MLHKAKTARLVITLYRHITDKFPTSYRHITNCRPTVGRLIVYVLGKTCRPSVGRHTADSRPTVGQQTANRFFGELFFTITQLSIQGNIVNVPSDVNSTVHCLPRPLSESQTIPFKLKRPLSYKHHYQFQNVRPKRVLDAAKYLVETSDLFKGEGIEVQNRWLDDINSTNNEDCREFVQTPSVLNPIDEAFSKKKMEDVCNNSISNTRVDSQNEVDNDDWCEVEECPSGVTDTLLQKSSIVENADRIISFAPG